MSTLHGRSKRNVSNLYTIALKRIIRKRIRIGNEFIFIQYMWEIYMPKLRKENQGCKKSNITYSQKRNVKLSKSAGEWKCNRMDSSVAWTVLLTKCQSLKRIGDHRDGHVHTFQLHPRSTNWEGGPGLQIPHQNPLGNLKNFWVVWENNDRKENAETEIL